MRFTAPTTLWVGWGGVSLAVATTRLRYGRRPAARCSSRSRGIECERFELPGTSCSWATDFFTAEVWSATELRPRSTRRTRLLRFAVPFESESFVAAHPRPHLKLDP